MAVHRERLDLQRTRGHSFGRPTLECRPRTLDRGVTLFSGRGSSGDVIAHSVVPSWSLDRHDNLRHPAPGHPLENGRAVLRIDPSRVVGFATSRQRKAACGPHSMQLLLLLHDIEEHRIDQISHGVGATVANGTEPGPMAEYFKRHGFEARVAPSSIEELRAMYSRKGKDARPYPNEFAIVMYQAYSNKHGKSTLVKDGQKVKLPLRDQHGRYVPENDYTSGHYSFVAGFDEHHVFLANPSEARALSYVPIAEFERRWHDSDIHNEPKFTRTVIWVRAKFPPEQLNHFLVPRAFYVP